MTDQIEFPLNGRRVTEADERDGLWGEIVERDDSYFAPKIRIRDYVDGECVRSVTLDAVAVRSLMRVLAEKHIEEFERDTDD